MATVAMARGKRTARIPLNTFSKLHLLRGHCLCGCPLCRPGKEPARLRLKPEAKEAWEEHREELLEAWRTEPGGGGFKAATEGGFGKWFPSFGEVHFDGVTWPKLDRAWPAAAKSIWRSMNTYIKG